jgi:hypothetical protein
MQSCASTRSSRAVARDVAPRARAGEKVVLFDSESKAILAPECTTGLHACLRRGSVGAWRFARSTDLPLAEESGTGLPRAAAPDGSAPDALERQRASALLQLRKVCRFKADRPAVQRASLASGLVAQMRDIGVSAPTLECIASALTRHGCAQLGEMPLLLEFASGAISALCASKQASSLLAAMQGP